MNIIEKSIRSAARERGGGWTQHLLFIRDF